VRPRGIYRLRRLTSPRRAKRPPATARDSAQPAGVGGIWRGRFDRLGTACPVSDMGTARHL